MPSAAEASLGATSWPALSPLAPLFPIPRCRRGPRSPTVVLRGPKCAIVSHSTPEGPLLSTGKAHRRCPPGAVRRHRPAYAARLRWRKGRMSRSGGGMPPPSVVSTRPRSHLGRNRQRDCYPFSFVLLGLATSDYLRDQFEIWMGLFLILALTMLVLEVLLKMLALLPRIDRYFRDGWNVFDFLAISFVIVSIAAAPADVAGYGMLIISVRLLRLLRGFSTVKDMRELAHRIVHARRFEYLLVILIIGSAVLLGLATSDYLLDQFEICMGLFLILVLTMLVLEVFLKMFALLPRIDRYFRDGWNVFDFLAISFMIVSIAAAPGNVAGYGILIISVRLLRLLRASQLFRSWARSCRHSFAPYRAWDTSWS